MSPDQSMVDSVSLCMRCVSAMSWGTVCVHGRIMGNYLGLFARALLVFMAAEPAFEVNLYADTSSVLYSSVLMAQTGFQIPFQSSTLQ